MTDEEKDLREAAEVAKPKHKVQCAFWDTKARGISPERVEVLTSLAPWLSRVREACAAHCKENWLPAFAMPAAPEGSDVWLVFGVEKNGMARFERSFPNRSAAEMWMIHHYG